jgi:hypothetical protein
MERGGWQRIEATVKQTEQVAAQRGIGVKNAFDTVTEFKDFIQTPEMLMKLNPADFGIEKWPDLTKLSKADLSPIMSDAYYAGYHIITDGQPKRYQTLLRKKIENLRAKGIL